MEQLKNLSDLAKFFIMLLMYTGYMTWWASGVSHDIDQLSNDVYNHITADTVITRETIKLAESVVHLQNNMKDVQVLTQESVKVHAKCGAIMDSILKRLEKVENK